MRRLQASPSVSDAERAALGITVADPGGAPLGPPTRKAKPAGVPLTRDGRFASNCDVVASSVKGVLGAEIWVNILPVGQPTPTDPASFNFVALDTRTPYTLDFAGADGGKNANYLLRWVNPTGEKGPWSETATATIGA